MIGATNLSKSVDFLFPFQYGALSIARNITIETIFICILTGVVVTIPPSPLV